MDLNISDSESFGMDAIKEKQQELEMAMLRLKLERQKTDGIDARDFTNMDMLYSF